jgi:transketolase
MKIDMRDAFFNRLVDRAKSDRDIVILSDDHGAFALNDFANQFPKQYINIGIAEQNMIGVAAGLALSGKKVFVYGITPFVSLRVLEHLMLDVAAMQLPVNIVSVGVGFTYSTDGPTHHGLSDLAVIRSIPGIGILNSSDPDNTSEFVDLVLARRTPHYIRIEKEILAPFAKVENFKTRREDGFSVLSSSVERVLFISTGRISHDVIVVCERLEKEFGIVAGLIDVQTIKPFPSERICDYISRSGIIIVVEEGYNSGLFMSVAKFATEFGCKSDIYSISVTEEFVFNGDSRENLLSKFGLDVNSILKKAINFIEKQSK